MSLLHCARRIGQRDRWSVPLSIGSAIFFVRLGVEVSEHGLDSFNSAIQKWVDGFRGSLDGAMVLLTEGGGLLETLTGVLHKM